MPACASVSAPPTHSADHFVSIHGARLRYRDQGRGPAVLLVHGWTLDLEMWDPQVDALRDSFRLIRLDRRGHGLSAGTPSAERDAEDLGALCDYLRLSRVALLGMSQGARSVLTYAGAAPTRVSALILDGPPALGSGSDPQVPLQRYVQLVRAHGIGAFRQEWACHPLMELRSHDPAMHALLAAMIARYPGNDLRPQAALPERAAARVRLQAMRTPTLVLSGEYDLARRRQAARQLAATLPNAESATIPRAGHLPNLDSPDVYNSVCRAFLLRHCRRRDPR
jgi:pimeloyl-ACP methyl ester carboxylesterase